jgi:hypothetical protein
LISFLESEGYERGINDMNEFALYARMREHGTLAEAPRDVPDARFALPSTIHWMRSLAILANDLQLDFQAASG